MTGVFYATEVKCPTCGRTREVSKRHSRRNTPCRDCVRGKKKTYGPPTDTERRWALKTFSDEEIVFIVESIWGERGDIEHVRTWRERLEPL